MAGLNNLITNTAQQSTTLPSWFDTAQQAVVNQAGNAMAAAPTPQNTVAQQAVNQLGGAANPFTQATGTLQGIASGAANPWITDASGNVTPNTQTALGGLFQAQNQQLNQLLPNVTAPVEGANIAGGNFGSLRGQTAVDKAKADAFAQLAAQQQQAALTNQQTGVQAGIGAGNVANQGIQNLLTAGQYQQAAPFTNVSNFGKILGGIQAPTTVSNQTQLSPLNQIGGLATLGTGIVDQLFGKAATGTSAAVPGLFSNTGIGDWLKSFGTTGGTGSGFDTNLNDYTSVGTGPIDWSAGPTENPDVPSWAWTDSYD
jgi:hypothetical protein